MSREELLGELLIQWEISRQEGVEPAPEELAHRHPDLIGELARRIAELRATDWLFEEHELEESADSDDRITLPSSTVSLEYLTTTIIESGLVSDSTVFDCRARLNRDAASDEPQALAAELVAARKLTPYQASVLLRGSKLPLRLGNYTILSELDSGGMGMVFKALHREMGRIVALKILPVSMTDSPEKVRRFQREVQAAAALAHPNIVTAFDAACSDGIYFLVMEHVQGRNLYKIVAEEGTLPVADAIDILLQSARGLQFVHQQGIIHRDVKPANLLLASDGTVKVLDFGLAHMDATGELGSVHINQSLTRDGAVMGTVAYMAPEQALDTRCADQRSDIYSLGCTLYYLLTGRPLYEGDTIMKTLVAHREQPVPSLRNARPDVPRELDIIFGRMIAKAPEGRFQSMDEVISALSSIERRALIVKDEGKKWPTKPAVPAIVGLVLLIAAIFGTTIFIRQSTPEGTLLLRINEPGATVQVLDDQNRVEITRRSMKDKLSIAVEPGTHRLKVTKSGFQFYTEEFTIQDGGTASIHAELVPLRRDALMDQVPLHRYRIGSGDVLGIYIEGVIGGVRQDRAHSPVLIELPKASNLPTAVGTPIPVHDDGRIFLPYVPPIQLEGMTLEQAREKITEAFTVEHKILLERSTVLVSLVHRRSPKTTQILTDYRLQPGDMLGVSIPGVLGREEEAPPVHFPENLPPAIGYPKLVGSDGTVHLPIVGSLSVSGLTLQEAREAFAHAYTVEHKILEPGRATIFVTLLKLVEPEDSAR